MRLRGIHYDIGTTSLDGTSTRPSLSAARIEDEVADIAERLHANAIRITGEDIDRIAIAARSAARRGMAAWLSPMLVNADQPTTLAAIRRTAEVGEQLRPGSPGLTLVVGCELSAFMQGIVPGDGPAERLALLGDMTRVISEVTERGVDPQATFDSFLTAAVGLARSIFKGPVTYAAGAWEQVEWTLFDYVGIDAYRDRVNRAGYRDLLGSYAAHGRPVVVTEAGCATFRGAADLGSLAWTAVDRSVDPRRLKAGVERDESAQAAELADLIGIFEQTAIAGAFIYTYVAPSYPASDDPHEDLDSASFALMRTWPDGHAEPKEAVNAVARRFAAVTMA